MPNLQPETSEFAPSPASSAGKGWVPQFTSAEYGKTPSDRCRLCSHFVYSQFFRVNGKKVCTVCAEQARAGLSTSSHGSLLSAMAFGCVSALALGLLYAAINLTVNLNATLFGIVVSTILMGLVIGKTVMAGANGVGGFRIQCVAALITYTAITLESVPAYLLATWNRPGFYLEWARVLPAKVASGLLSPMTQITTTPANAAIALALLVVAMGIAWRLTRVQPLTVAGPFDSNPIA